MDTNNNGPRKRGPKPKNLIKDIRRKAYKTYSSEEKIRIVLEGMRGEESIANICRKYGINDSVITNGAKIS